MSRYAIEQASITSGLCQPKVKGKAQGLMTPKVALDRDEQHSHP